MKMSNGDPSKVVKARSMVAGEVGLSEARHGPLPGTIKSISNRDFRLRRLLASSAT